MVNSRGSSQQVGTKACKSESMILIHSLSEEGSTNLPTQLYWDPPPSLLTIVGSAVATIVFSTHVIRWLDMRKDERQTWSSAAKKTHNMNPVNT